MNLIANTGIHFYSTLFEINSNDNLKIYFHEWFDINAEQLRLEIAHYFQEDDIWVRKMDLHSLGYLKTKDEEVNGKLICKGSVLSKWDDLREDFFSNGKETISIETDNPEDSGCFVVGSNSCRWDKFEDKWLPFPVFLLNISGKTEFGPTNWCRFKLIPYSNNGLKKQYNLLIAFDTRCKFGDQNFEGAHLLETPVFRYGHDFSMDYGICNEEFQLIDFCFNTKYVDCDWVNSYILNHYHKVNKIEDLRIAKPKLKYLSEYIYILSYIRSLNILPKFSLLSGKDVATVNVDLVIDVGNSRTCAVLFDDSDFTKVESLSLQNLTNPIKDGKLNCHTDPFDMRLAFRLADFGDNLINGSMQFVFPSMVRLGSEAMELIHKAKNSNKGVEKLSISSSPKRYLWDNQVRQNEWENIILYDEDSQSLFLKGVSQQINSDGSLNSSGSDSSLFYYSRKALMTFAFLEILAQATMQINSYKYRNNWGSKYSPRKINRIIITSPAAMSRVEQTALRGCAEDAAIILNRFFSEKYDHEVDLKHERSLTNVIPASKSFLNIDSRKEWIYDEATCSQFVYLYAEIGERYLKNCKEYFNFYGRIRKDLANYDKKSLTVGSVDIGAGTTDVMIAAYKYSDDDQCLLTPVPLFWESFYLAGDDLLKELIRLTVIEGQYGMIYNKLKQLGRENIEELIVDYFGKDNARQTVESRQMRSEFNLQISIPVVSYFLELLNDDKVEKCSVSFNDIFKNIKPTNKVLKHFSLHFGFSIEDSYWDYDKSVISKIVERTFDGLIGKISVVLSYFGCDIVLLSGRPTSLKSLSDLFLKYYAVSPNRLITMSNYRIGNWYPFQDGRGYFTDSKSIVAVGAMICSYASTRGSLNGFSLDLSELVEKMQPTSEYFAKSEHAEPFISPKQNLASLEISQLPVRFWCRQLNTAHYPTRPFYALSFNKDAIAAEVIKKFNLQDMDQNSLRHYLDRELDRLQRLIPFNVTLQRENYPQDRETLKLVSVEDKNKVTLPVKYFLLQIQSMAEIENYWLDSGEFINLGTTFN